MRYYADIIGEMNSICLAFFPGFIIGYLTAEAFARELGTMTDSVEIFRKVNSREHEQGCEVSINLVR